MTTLDAESIKITVILPPEINTPGAAEYTYGCILLEGAFGSEVNVDEGADWIIKAAKRG